MTDPKHLVRTGDLRDADFTRIRHPLNPRSEVRMHRLGDRVGMQRAHLSLARVPPGRESFLPHAHGNQEEFLFILEGRGLALLGDAEVEVSRFPSIGKVGLFQRGQVSFYDEDSAKVLRFRRGGRASRRAPLIAGTRHERFAERCLSIHTPQRGISHRARADTATADADGGGGPSTLPR